MMVQFFMVRIVLGNGIEKRGERSAGYGFIERQISRKPHELIIVLVLQQIIIIITTAHHYCILLYIHYTHTLLYYNHYHYQYCTSSQYITVHCFTLGTHILYIIGTILNDLNSYHHNVLLSAPFNEIMIIAPPPVQYRVCNNNVQ